MKTSTGRPSTALPLYRLAFDDVVSDLLKVTSAQALSRLIREIGYEPVLIGGLAMGKHLMPGTPLAGERTPDSGSAGRFPPDLHAR